MNTYSYIDIMAEKKSALNMPEGMGMMAYLEKGEWGPAAGFRPKAREVYELRVENGAIVVPPALEKKLGLAPDARRLRSSPTSTA